MTGHPTPIQKPDRPRIQGQKLVQEVRIESIRIRIDRSLIRQTAKHKAVEPGIRRPRQEYRVIIASYEWCSCKTEQHPHIRPGHLDKVRSRGIDDIRAPGDSIATQIEIAATTILQIQATRSLELEDKRLTASHRRQRKSAIDV